MMVTIGLDSLKLKACTKEGQTVLHMNLLYSTCIHVYACSIELCSSTALQALYIINLRRATGYSLSVCMSVSVYSESAHLDGIALCLYYG